MKAFLAILGLLLSGLGVYFAWLQYQQLEEAKNAAQPNVVVCLRALSYQRSDTQGSGDKALTHPQGKVSFRLVNKGPADVTVRRIFLNPIGTDKDGRHGGLSIEFEIDRNVPGLGVISVEDMAFSSNEWLYEKFWIDKPDAVAVQAYWADVPGPMLTCILRGKWLCGKQTAGGGLSGDLACQ